MDIFLAGLGHFVFTITVFIGAKILMLKAKPRGRPLIRYAFVFALLLVLCAALSFTDEWQKQYMFGFPYITSSVLGIWGIFSLFFLHDVGPWRGIYGYAGGMMFQFAVSAPSKMITMFNDKVNPVYLTIPLTLFIVLAYGGFLYYTTRRHFIDPESFHPGPATTIITTILAAA
ncbi:MAG: hypothetical protein IKN69_03825, partial [Bacilli bacterium]|nr:hypothetical protein [Bacilli bacterium]